MRNVIISFTLFICMLILNMFSVMYLNKVCNELQSLNSTIESQINSGSFDNAYNTSIEFLNKWDKYSNTISIFVDHAEIDNINNELWKLTQYTKCKNKDESLASAHVLKFFLEHIADMEKVNVQNIF
ncbi:DUF4363 family protein [Clostridium sp. JN-1]|uniref:DUF4363 family protein n=1 Tax=Clostridium sp. JN-1 TaxID=2483110 RepID=UPI000F0B771B|nr:DUF4363 family protein [Clostridium sp. JN-1]